MALHHPLPGCCCAMPLRLARLPPLPGNSVLSANVFRGHQVTALLSAWVHGKLLRCDVRKAWPKLVDEVKFGRWISVRGPSAALILSPRRNGWEAVCSDMWIVPQGCARQAQGEALNLDALLDATARSVVLQAELHRADMDLAANSES